MGSLGLVVVQAALVAASTAPQIRLLVTTATLVLILVVRFRAAAILRSDFARTGRRSIRVGGVEVFFLGCLYLQHLMNKAADTSKRRVVRK